MRRAATLTTRLLGLSVALVVLVAAGRGPLSGPPLLDPRAWPAWAGGRDPIDAAVAVLRTGLALVVAYLLAMTLLGLVARLVALPWLVVGVGRAGGPVVRRMVGGALGAGLAMSMLTPVAASAQTAPPPTAVMQLLPEEDPPTTMTPPPTVPGHVVEPGDSFWRIADRHLRSTLGRPPTDREVVRYWRDLIAANTDRLATPDPNLIYPGQRFRLP